ncbi:hypothetical protein ZYGR_0N06470 [Zygosaccharomyces rouxii]|uniref:RNA helicase n=2 Tax=Zygosaccharomyces rouxii TaxID=4956 RepID=C5DWI7_ZYGRC|nr:uncharacterized protein ZYRO0D15180g [Zygosaccharomyces rouxii]KAH9201067.1 P-loop containing nucleoside triphosphate hydrolase protein [Zygosaccharomyces rouxii]GAV49240.1 hypothetical protein ZYGR_0N06470 [Zygosaccharomyces rouxii]CAR28156.1 ZYRO0D15180p [Zygosaccharomyces rouxii]
MSDIDGKLFEIVGTDDELIINFIRDVKRNSQNIQDFETKIGKMDVGLSSEAIREIYDVLAAGAGDKDNVREQVSKLLKTSVGIDDQVVVKFLLGIVDKTDSENEFCQELDKLDCGIPQSIASKIYWVARGDAKVKLEEEADKGLALPNFRAKYDDLSDPRDLLPKKKNPFLSHRDPGPILNKIYPGRIKNITAFGCFVQIHGTQEKNSDGLVHISEMTNHRVRRPQDLVQLGQEVFIKVIKLQKNGNVSLSMKNIDQLTGQEIAADEPINEMRGRRDQVQNQSGVQRRPLTSPERWEIRQLIASGAASAEDYPELNQPKTNAVVNTQEHKQQEEQVDVELNTEDEPAFLKGETERGQQKAEAPIKNVKIAKGSMNRVATNGSNLMKTHREEKSKLKKEIERRIRQKQALDDPTTDTATQRREVDQLKQQLVLTAWERSRMKEDLTFGKQNTLPLSDQRKSLPVYGMREELIQAVEDNQFLVIVGETGSGKTTQITQFLNEVGFGEHGIIGCTQPRRVAAVSVAQRVAEEVGCRVGNEVGYTIRFEDRTSENTRIKYMTDGMLQREALLDPKMSRYSVIMLDEAHERTVATDVLFALLKQAAVQRPDLKVIVTSATLDSVKFSEYFHNCPVKHIPGKTYPVDVVYSSEPQMDYLEAALDCVMQIHVNEDPGDILVFLTGQEEIDSCCEILYQRVKILGKSIDELLILPVYSALPSEIQSKIFEPTPAGSRKVVFATNIAETSITIDGIRFVVDPGFAKINIFNSRTGMEQLVVSPISQAQANQRKGRAGRTGPGKCYRLYTELSFRNEMLPNAIPEIQRQNLSHTILLLKAMGINDLLHFDFMDPPPRNLLIGALEELFNLEALEEDGYLTKLGSRMSQFPTEPTLSRALLSSVTNNCSEEIITIISMLSIPGVFYRPRDKQQDADNKKIRFHHPYGDHLTLLNVYQRWQLANCTEQFCTAHYLQYRHLRRARDVRNQLTTIFRKLQLPIVSCRGDHDIIRRTLVYGFFMNAAKRDSHVGYKTISGEIPVVIHPSSSLHGREHEYVIYHSLLLTTREYMSQVTAIDPSWLLEAAPHFYKVADESKKRAKITPMFQRHNAKRIRR